MKKGILLTIVAVLLVGVVVVAIWYINEEGKMRAGTKDAFIPYNSALVLSINAGAALMPEVEKAFATDLQAFRDRLLSKVTDTLRENAYVLPDSYVLAARLEGKSDVAFLYVMDNKDVLSRSEISGFLCQNFAGEKEAFRKYDRHKIFTLKRGKEEVYFAVCGGIILLSDSDLYIEDALKQFDIEEAGEEMKSRYRNLNKYFSAGAGVNIFLNTAAFTDLLPLYVQTKKIFPHVDITRFFKWGALDGEFGKEGICLNGFLQYSGLDRSYIRTFEKQQPLESGIENVLPARLISVGLLNLSQPSAYFAALDAYRYSVGRKDAVFNRKQQFAKMFGKDTEEEIRKLLQGEFAVIDLAYNEATHGKDALVVACLKSGSLCRMLIEKMMKTYARFDGKEVEAYRKEYHIDREKSFSYYYFPAEDFASVYWGDIFEGVPNRYLFVEDNYLVFASTEKALKEYIQDYVHGSFIRDAEWYRHLKTKLSAKFNLAYFARTAEVLPFYKYLAANDFQKYLSQKVSQLPVFPSWALQWSNEGEMLYNTLFLSTLSLQEDTRPHVLWQTKVGAKVSMKPVPVMNHVTGERELFVQDDKNTVYLINDAGRILWKVPVEGPINSEVYQVDLFKNGKLQYLFSTSGKMYLIDRNGNAAGRFPVAFRAACPQGITVFDYDQNRNYRIFVPCDDRKVYLYGLDGNIVQGWNPRKADKPIVSKVQHYRIDNKDYIVFADRYRLYILDRKGKERVKVSSVFDLPDHTAMFLTRKDGQAMLAVPAAGGTVHLVNFAGQVQTFQAEGLMAAGYKMNVADVNGDGTDECVFTSGDNLLICQLNGKKISGKKLEVQVLDFPYIYRFSGKDIRIGLTDPRSAQMLLLSPDGSFSRGFPISGDSPFSIVFSGNDGFFLFAGADDGSVIKYKVQL